MANRSRARKPAPLALSTRAIHGGQLPDPSTGAVSVPIYATSTFVQSSPGVHQGYDYARSGNPTRDAFERGVASVEGGTAGFAFGSGLAAIATVLDGLEAGSHVLASDDLYGGTWRLFERVRRASAGLDFSFVDLTDLTAVAAAIRPTTRLLWIETPTNPTLKVIDIERLARVARQHGAIVVTDNTFATPMNQRPAALGSDLIVYSATKFLAGHSDVLGGLVSGRAALIERIYHYREIAGSTLHADAAYSILRGMKTLALRMARHNSSAQWIASHLAAHPRVSAVYYPGLATHPGHAIAARQMQGYGGVLSFVPDGGPAALATVLNRLRYAQRAAHLGGVATTAGPPSVTSHVELTVEERARAGIPETLIRYSVGIEDPADLIADLDQALAAI